MTNKLFFFKGLLRFVNLVSTLSRLDPALAMYIVKYEELRYVVAEHTADESLRLVLVDTERTGHTYQRRSLHASHLCKTTKKVPPAALPPPPALCASASPSPLRSRPALPPLEWHVLTAILGMKLTCRTSLYLHLRIVFQLGSPDQISIQI